MANLLIGGRQWLTSGGSARVTCREEREQHAVQEETDMQNVTDDLLPDVLRDALGQGWRWRREPERDR